MKKTTFYLIIINFVWIISCISCANSEMEGKEMETGQISYDPELLIGEWDAIKFAYTEDGNEISDVVNITSSSLVIPVAPTMSECGSLEEWELQCINNSRWLCSIFGNSIKFTMCGTTKIGLPSYPHEELDIYWAFDNAYSFAIKEKELMIFFTEDEGKKDFISIAEEKKMNLIIFKKQ